ncbi:MAG: glycosyltransferase family 2 protein [Phycisphaerae bacterium]
MPVDIGPIFSPPAASEASAIRQEARAFPQVVVVIPAWNEEGSIGRVIADLPAVRAVVVADNNSADYTAQVARKFGATVVPAPVQGYGSACLAALAHVATLDPPPAVVAFIDADYSDHPEELPALVVPILAGEADFVVGSRMLKRQARGALLPQAVFGNKLACFLMRVLFGQSYSDLGPFRAIRYDALKRLRMCDTNFGWTVEMQIKAAKANLRIREVAVSYRPRIGVSKITGTLKGTFRAGWKILYTIGRYGLA